jgi:hypothetical protein
MFASSKSFAQQTNSGGDALMNKRNKPNRDELRMSLTCSINPHVIILLENSLNNTRELFISFLLKI